MRFRNPTLRTAVQLGHSVETLVSTYVGALDDEEHIANLRVDTILGQPLGSDFASAGPSADVNGPVQATRPGVPSRMLNAARS
jgi:hypothetical protein